MSTDTQPETEAPPQDAPEASAPEESSRQLDLEGVFDETPDEASEDVQQQGTTETVEPPQTAVGQTQQPEVAPSLLDQAQQLGFEGVESEADAQARLVEAYRLQQEQELSYQQQIQQMQNLAQLGNQYLSLQQDPAFQQYLTGSQNAPQQQPVPGAQPGAGSGGEAAATWWQPPEFDTADAQRWRETKIDQQTGQPYEDWKEDTPAHVRAKAGEWVDYVTSWQNKFASNPDEALAPAIEHHFDRLFKDRYAKLQEDYQQQVQQVTTQQTIEQINQNNQDWLYQRDPRTNQPFVDPISGEPVMSEAGMGVQRYVQEATQIGITDPQAKWKYATEMYYYKDLLAQEQAQQAQPGQPQAPATAADVNQQKKMDHLRAAAGGGMGGARQIPNRDGATPDADNRTRKQNRREKPGQELLRQMAAEGMI